MVAGRSERGPAQIASDFGSRVGRRLGTYQLLEELGRGGQAVVYKAVAAGGHGFEREVAIKVLRPDAEDLESLGRLADEARLLARMRHPGIVSVHWFGPLEFEAEDAPVHALVMDYVRGCTLRDVLVQLRREESRLPLTTVLDLGIAVAEALAYAHGLNGGDGQALGLVHRDLKPSNVLLSETGHALLVDFGVAKARDRISQSTIGRELRGTVRYMAPEQLRGDAVDSRTDVFALGGLLVELATGQPLLLGGSADWLQELLRFDSGPALERVRAVSPALANLLAPALDTEVHGRADVAHLAASLRRLRADLSGVASSSEDLVARVAQARADQADPFVTPRGRTVGSGLTRPPSAPAPKGRSPLLWGALALLLGVAGVGVGTLLPSRLDPPDPAGVATSATTVDEPGPPSKTAESGLDIGPVPAEQPEPRPSAVEPAVVVAEPPAGSPPGASAPSAEESPAVPVAATGTVLIGSDHVFRGSVGDVHFTTRDARRGIELPVGAYEAMLTCLDCPAGVEPSRSLHFEVRDGGRTRASLRFEAADEAS